nr:MAG TPA: hypothetical protein [Caudoviricetes sp.]
MGLWRAGAIVLSSGRILAQRKNLLALRRSLRERF